MPSTLPRGLVRFGWLCGLVSLGASLLLVGCVLSSPSRPMRVLDKATLGPQAARGLVVMLPGFGDDPTRFEEYGLVRAIQENTAYDAVAANAHFGYYRVFNLEERLRQDIIGPALDAGYREIWLVGVSMGGFGALSYAESHPEEVRGVVLLAPYLGEDVVLDEIREAGLDAWEPELGDTPPADREAKTRANWAWLRAQLRRPPVPVYLGFGESDPSASNHELLASALPEDHALHIPGGHTWHVWRPLFEQLVSHAFGP